MLSDLGINSRCQSRSSMYPSSEHESIRQTDPYILTALELLVHQESDSSFHVRILPSSDGYADNAYDQNKF